MAAFTAGVVTGSALWQGRSWSAGLLSLPQGRPAWILPEVEAAGSIWTMNGIDEQVAARSQLEWSATHDPPTGMANRAAFHARLDRVFGAFPRSVPAVLLFIDLGHFKPINDSAGHTVRVA